MNNVFQNFWIPNLVEGMTTTTPTINKVNTMTPRQNDLVVKKDTQIDCQIYEQILT